METQKVQEPAPVAPPEPAPLPPAPAPPAAPAQAQHVAAATIPMATQKMPSAPPRSKNAAAGRQRPMMGAQTARVMQQQRPQSMQSRRPEQVAALPPRPASMQSSRSWNHAYPPNVSAGLPNNYYSMGLRDAYYDMALPTARALSQAPRPPTSDSDQPPATARPGMRSTSSGFGYNGVIRQTPFMYQDQKAVLGLYHAKKNWISPAQSIQTGGKPEGYPGYPVSAEYYFNQKEEQYQEAAERHKKSMKKGTWLYKKPIEPKEAYREFDRDSGMTNFASPAMGFGQRHRNWYKNVHRNQFGQYPVRHERYPS
jgi:hypothetical protein